jgi:hypothetical protein
VKGIRIPDSQHSHALTISVTDVDCSDFWLPLSLGRNGAADSVLLMVL